MEPESSLCSEASKIQQAVFEELHQSQRPMSVRDLIEQIRREHPEFKQVADFDFRSALLAMKISGMIESTSTNQIYVLDWH